MNQKTINEIRTHVRKILKETKMKENDELISAVKALIVDIESMNCVPENTVINDDSGYWFGEFSEYQENADGDMIIEWPNLAISVERLKKILDKRASQ
jgi:hypothetical protein